MICTLPTFQAGAALDRDVFATIRRRAILEGCKWDPQVGDVSTLAEFPLLLARESWCELASAAEQLALETINAEREILARPNLLKQLGLPRALRRALEADEEPTPAATRVMRFDFHLTPDGWRISEVNSDVPGGFTEASFFTRLIAEQCGPAEPPGLPIEVWADAISRAAGSGGSVALLTAPGFMEDHQIMAYLGRHLHDRGGQAHLANPSQIAWQDGYASLRTEWVNTRLEAIVRFFQGEWLAELPRRSAWPHFFRGGRTPVGNPGLAVISESKRFPLVWDNLRTPLPTWRRLLPETRDPREAPWQSDEGWLVKSAMCNTGDEVCLRDLLPPREWTRTCRSVKWFPGNWIAQRRFESLPIDTPRGLMHVCLGVYTIDGTAAGAYARLASRPLIDFAALDAALLIQADADPKNLHDEPTTAAAL